MDVIRKRLQAKVILWVALILAVFLGASYSITTSLTLKSLNEEHDLTVVLVTHDEAIAQGSHRRIQLKDGGIINEQKNV